MQLSELSERQGFAVLHTDSFTADADTQLCVPKIGCQYSYL